jgi:hypothetical protein
VLTPADGYVHGQAIQPSKWQGSGKSAREKLAQLAHVRACREKRSAFPTTRLFAHKPYTRVLNIDIENQGTVGWMPVSTFTKSGRASPLASEPRQIGFRTHIPQTNHQQSEDRPHEWEDVLGVTSSKLVNVQIMSQLTISV